MRVATSRACLLALSSRGAHAVKRPRPRVTRTGAGPMLCQYGPPLVRRGSARFDR